MFEQKLDKQHISFQIYKPTRNSRKTHSSEGLLDNTHFRGPDDTIQLQPLSWSTIFESIAKPDCIPFMHVYMIVPLDLDYRVCIARLSLWTKLMNNPNLTNTIHLR